MYSKDIYKLLKQLLDEKIPVIIDGETFMVTKRAVLLMHYFNKGNNSKIFYHILKEINK